MVDTNPNAAHILLIVDRSGSMMSIKEDAEGGINSFLDEQRNLRNASSEKIDVTISLADFNDEFNWWVRNTRLNDINKYILKPGGTTALLDAIGKGINEDTERLALSSAPPPGKNVCVIVTDGQENSSREWTDDGVKKLIEIQKNEHGWEFVFLATDITTIKMAQGVGLRTTQFSGTRAGTRAAYGVTGQSVSSYLVGTTSNVQNPDVVSDES